tara:strand:- start:110171 stop:110743 length:573 start_codon:yes stop_codon:yes gene_type:complete
MKKHVLLGLVLATSAGGAVAAEVGLGVSLDLSYSPSSAISVPIIVSDSLLIEPYYREEDEDNKRTGTFALRYKYKSSELGVGLFYRSEVKNGISYYMGARVGYLDNGYLIEESDGGGGEERTYGYAVSPTLALQYEVMPKLMISGELDWAFSSAKGRYYSVDTLPASIVQNDVSKKTRETGSRIFVRYFF